MTNQLFSRQSRSNHLTYLVWSERNAKSKITLILKTPLWDIFRPSPCCFRLTFCSGLSTAEWWWWTCFCNSSEDPIPALLEAVLGQRDISQFRLLPGTEKQACRGDMWEKQQLADHLHAFCHHLKSWPEVAVWTMKSSLYRNQSQDDSLGHFGLIISWDLARAFLMWGYVDSFPAGLS